MDLGLQNKRALVSASTGGIGEAIALELAREGAHVIVNGRSQERVDAALQAITKVVPDATLEALVADLGTEAGAEKAFAQVPEVDILVNNLGIYGAKDFADITDQDWRDIFETNVFSGVRLTRHYLQGMLARNEGRVVFISSESGLAVPHEMIHYGTTKTAQLAISRGLAETTKGSRVTVNTILPGPTRTEGVEIFIRDLYKDKNLTDQEAQQAFMAEYRADSLIQRLIDPAEVAALVCFICSARAGATNGAALRVEGGLLRQLA